MARWGERRIKSKEHRLELLPVILFLATHYDGAINHLLNLLVKIPKDPAQRLPWLCSELRYHPIQQMEGFIMVSESKVEKRMTSVTLVGSSVGDNESSKFDIIIDDLKVGSAIAYLASEEEIEAFKKKLKKRLKVGEAYTVKIFLDEKYIPKKSDLISIKDSILAKYPSCDSSKILFARAEGGKIVPLTDGSKLEGSEIGTG